MATTTDATCVHRKDPTDCSACRELAYAMGLLGAGALVRGWYREEAIAAWGRACGVAGPLYFLARMDRPTCHKAAHPSPLNPDLCECGSARGHR